MVSKPTWRRRRDTPSSTPDAPSDELGTGAGTAAEPTTEDDVRRFLDQGGAAPATATAPAPAPVVADERTVVIPQATTARADDRPTAPPSHVIDGTDSTDGTDGADGSGQAGDGRRDRLRLSILDSTPVALYTAAHPKQVLVTALALGLTALSIGRPLREALVVTVTVGVGQTILGWHNDLVDRDRDARTGAVRKPLAEDRVDPGSVWFALVVAVLAVIPLSVSTGVTAGSAYLASLAVGLLGNVALRRGVLSWVPWAFSFGLYPAYLTYGGWGGGADGDPPQVAVVVAAALVGVGVHFVRAVWGLVADDAEGWNHLPLRLGRRLGATRLLVVSASFTAVMVAVLALLGNTIGFRVG